VGSADVQGKRVALEDVVKLVVKSIAGTATVEALETDIESGGVVLDGGSG
jgi:hypothetical protein